MCRLFRVNSVLIVAGAAALVAVVAWLMMMGQAVRGPTPYDRQGLRRLQAIAASAAPLIVALGRYRRDHGAYPSTLSALTLPYAHSDRWYYAGGKDGYSLYYKISWDPGLRFEYPTPAEWVYDPGNGNPKVSLSEGVVVGAGR